VKGETEKDIKKIVENPELKLTRATWLGGSAHFFRAWYAKRQRSIRIALDSSPSFGI